MKTKWINKIIKYDGSQLRPLFAYENFNILGNSVLAWLGPCEIPFSNMKDLEDVLAVSPIRGGFMLHFIVEIFHQNLFSGVILQRLFASIVKDEIMEMLAVKKSKYKLFRDGDDIYSLDRKLSISIASQSVLSTQIHFAVNVTNEGTPVKTLCLEDLKIEPEVLAKKVLKKFQTEFDTIMEATMKVRSL
ncbi:MAG: DUF366 family protein [Deltaproteobacteria bacterium]|jgi:hypothetical protein|nr:DUF366 family protein [Deltaproteobacteria bacterium]